MNSSPPNDPTNEPAESSSNESDDSTTSFKKLLTLLKTLPCTNEGVIIDAPEHVGLFIAPSVSKSDIFSCLERGSQPVMVIGVEQADLRAAGIPVTVAELRAIMRHRQVMNTKVGHDLFWSEVFKELVFKELKFIPHDHEIVDDLKKLQPEIKKGANKPWYRRHQRW